MHEEVDRFLIVLQRDKGFSGNTIAAYRNDLAQFQLYVASPPDQDHLGPVVTWQELTDIYLNQFVLYLKEREYAAASVARKSAAVKSFCHFLASEGVLRADPSEKMISPKVGKYTPKAITPDQVARLLAQPQAGSAIDKPETIRDYAMLQTLYATGMRVSELVSLDTQDVDSDGQGVLCTGKAGRQRELPLRAAWDAMLHYLEAGRPQLAPEYEVALFVNHRGTRLTRQGFWLILKTYADRAGIQDVTPHTLRHSFAWNALHNGSGMREVQQLLGHVSVSTTQVYRRVTLAPDLATSSHGEIDELADFGSEAVPAAVN